MVLGILEAFLIGLIAITAIAIPAIIAWYLLQLYLYFYCWSLGLPSPRNKIRVQYNMVTKMSDGIKLVGDLYRPADKGRYPLLLLRTPYGKGSYEHGYPFIATIFSCQGYAVFVQDVRGKYGSDGVFFPFVSEEKDGKETIEWAVKQPFCNGKVALWGLSYMGNCSWLATPNAHPALKTIVPMYCCQNSYNGWIDGGVPYLKDILMWLSRHHGKKAEEIPHHEIDNILLQLPVLQFDKRLKGGIETFKAWMYHLHEDEYWQVSSVSHRREYIKLPILFIAGWFDRFVNNTFKDFHKTVTCGTDPLTRQSRLIVGPWGHQPTTEYPDIHFGPQGKISQQARPILKWFDYWLAGDKAEFDTKKPIDYFMMGRNEWRQTAYWPPEGTYEEKLFLNSKGRANSFFGDGLLTIERPGELLSDKYLYNPEDPVPSIGNKMLYGNMSDGPREQSQLYQREDILFYQSLPLNEDVEIAGPVTLVLYLASSAVDTDFAAKICDLHPNNKAYYLANGFQRMRFLDSVKATHGIEADKVYRLELLIGQTAHTFLKGHRIQLQICSSDFPNHERNLNTGGSNEGDSEEITAMQTIFHGKSLSSHLILPRLP